MRQNLLPSKANARQTKLPLLVAGAVLSAAVTGCGVGLRGEKSAGPPALTAPLRGLSSTEGEKIFSFRRAGLTGDRSQTQRMIGLVTSPAHPHPVAVETALHALARLGAAEALPAFDLAAKNRLLEPLPLEAMRQRLLAEASAGTLPDGPRRATAKIDAFYRGLNLSPFQSPDVAAARELADMVYRGGPAGFAQLDGIKRIAGTPDYPSALKLRLAPLPRPARVRALIDDLARTRYLSTDQRYEMQLADDEGALAGRAAAQKLREMDGHRADYPREGYDALFSVLSGAGDSSQAGFCRAIHP